MTVLNLKQSWMVIAVYEDTEKPVGIFNEHIIDIAKRFSGLNCLCLYFLSTDKPEEYIMRSIPVQSNVCNIDIIHPDFLSMNIIQRAQIVKQLSIEQPPEYSNWNILPLDCKSGIKVEFLK